MGRDPAFRGAPADCFSSPRREGRSFRVRKSRRRASTHWAAAVRRPSTFAVDDSPFGQVIRRDFNRDTVSGHDPDEILAHLTGNMSQNFVTALKFDHELSIRERLNDAPFRADGFLFGHTDLLPQPPLSRGPVRGWKKVERNEFNSRSSTGRVEPPAAFDGDVPHKRRILRTPLASPRHGRVSSPGG